MAKSKQQGLADTLRGGIQKKELPNIQEAEEITQKVYSSTQQDRGAEQKTEETQKTTLDLPKRVHYLAKIVSMEEETTLKGYLLDLIESDLRKRGKL